MNTVYGLPSGNPPLFPVGTPADPIITITVEEASLPADVEEPSLIPIPDPLKVPSKEKEKALHDTASELADKLEEFEPLIEAGETLVDLGVTSTEIYSHFEEIEGLTESSFAMSTVMHVKDTTIFAFKMKAINSKIASLEGKQDPKSIEELDKAVKEKKSISIGYAANSTRFAVTAAQTGIEEGGKILSEVAAQSSQALTITAKFLGWVGALYTLITSSADIHIIRAKRRRIARELEANLQEQSKTNDSLKLAILQLRVKALNKQDEELKVALVKNSIAISGSILGMTASVGGIVLLIMAAVAVAAGVVAALSALGIAAGILGGIAIVLGLAYLAYKYRHQILHAFQTLGFKIQNYWDKRQIDNLTKKIEDLSERQERLAGIGTQRLRKLEKLEVKYQNDPKILARIVKIREKIIAKMNIAAERRIHLLDRINLLETEVTGAVQESMTRQQEMVRKADFYQYFGQYLGKFDEVELQDLQNLQQNVVEKDYDVPGATADMSPEVKWNHLMNIIVKPAWQP